MELGTGWDKRVGDAGWEGRGAGWIWEVSLKMYLPLGWSCDLGCEFRTEDEFRLEVEVDDNVINDDRSKIAQKRDKRKATAF